MAARIRDGLRRKARERVWRLLSPEVSAALDKHATGTLGEVRALIDEHEGAGPDEPPGTREIASRALPRHRTGALLTVPGIADVGDAPPVPPRDLWAVHADYLETGERHSRTMRELCAKHGRPIVDGMRILDFGCGTGRVLRHLVDVTESGEVWGADLDSERIDWCRSHLTPPFRFITTDTAPHLPFEDNYFDLVFAGSVFTHITDQDDSWLMELRRITRPGGLLYLSVIERDMIGSVLAQEGSTPYKDWFVGGLDTEADLDAAFLEGVAALDAGAGMFAVGEDSYIPNVFHDREYLRAYWGSMLEWLEIVEEAWFRQAVVVLRKA